MDKGEEIYRLISVTDSAGKNRKTTKTFTKQELDVSQKILEPATGIMEHR